MPSGRPSVAQIFDYVASLDVVGSVISVVQHERKLCEGHDPGENLETFAKVNIFSVLHDSTWEMYKRRDYINV